MFCSYRGLAPIRSVSTRIVLGAIASTFAALACSGTARADTYKLFNVNGTFNNGATLTGTVNLDLDDTAANNSSKAFDFSREHSRERGNTDIQFHGNEYLVR